MRPFLVLAALLSVSRLAAQDAEIVVTATKEPAPATTLPVPVVVLGPEQLDHKTSVSDALSQTLAVRLQSLTPGEPALTAPGFGENGFGRVSLLLDGVSQNNPDMAPPPLNLVPLFAIERIEIVRAPMTALYGNAAGGGAVNLVTKTPRRLAFQAGTAAEWGGTNTQNAAFGLPVGEGGLLFSLARDQSLPTRDRSQSGRYQGWSKFQLPFSNQEMSAWLAFTRADTQLPGAIAWSDYKADPDRAQNAGDSVVRTETAGGASWSWSGEDWNLMVPVTAVVRRLDNTTPSFQGNSTSTLVRWTWEPQVSGQGNWLDADADWSSGLSAALDSLLIDRRPTGASTAIPVTAQIDRRAASAWGRGQLGWDDRWFVSAAVRVEASRTQARSDQSPGIDGKRDFWPMAGDIGLTWLPADGVKTSLELAHVYRYPFTDEIVSPYGYPSDSFLNGLDAEVGNGATMSAQWDWDHWAVSLSGTVLKMDNEVALNAAYVNENLGPVWHMSSLGSLSWKLPLPAGSLSLGGEYGAERATFADGGNEGKNVPLIPTHRARLWAKAENRGLGSFEASWSLSSSFYAGQDFGNVAEALPGRQSLDVAVLIPLGSREWVLKVYGRNLTGDRTPDAAFWNSFTGTSVYPSEGRVFGVSLTWTL